MGGTTQSSLPPVSQGLARVQHSQQFRCESCGLDLGFALFFFFANAPSTAELVTAPSGPPPNHHQKAASLPWFQTLALELPPTPTLAYPLTTAGRWPHQDTAPFKHSRAHPPNTNLPTPGSQMVTSCMTMKGQTNVPRAQRCHLFVQGLDSRNIHFNVKCKMQTATKLLGTCGTTCYTDPFPKNTGGALFCLMGKKNSICESVRNMNNIIYLRGF